MNSLTQYIELHDQHLETIEAHAPQVLNDLRRHARRALEGAMLPRKGQEDYEATDLNAMFALDYGVNIARLDFDIDPATVFHCDVPNMSTCMYYTYNDIFHPSGTARKLEGGVVVESLAQAAVNHPELLERCGQLASLDDPAVALNTLLAQDGILVYVPDGFTADRTIQLVNILNYTRPMMVVRRVLVILGRNAHARMLVCDHTQSTEVDCLSSQVVEIFAGEDASFDYYDMEESGPMTHRVSSIYVHQQGRSNVLVDGITLTNGTSRNNYHVVVDGEHAETQLLGMTIASGTQHVDTYTHIDHRAPRCHSNEMFKYVLSEQAIGAFAGKILVQPDCPRVEAYQGNRNICASDTARMYTKPQLEIYTDDVKCSHGTTIGQLDDEALFYMRTRGISLDEARNLLMQAFMADVIDAVRLDTLRDRLRYLTEKRFNGTLANCGACVAACR